MTIFRCPINITFPGAGSPGANIWHFRTIGAIGAAENSQAAAMTLLIKNFYFALSALYPTGTTISIGTVTEVGTAREITPGMTTVTGGGTGSAMQALAAVVTWKTTIAARRGRGRTFVGPLSTGVVQSDGTITDANLSTIRSAATSLVSASLADGNGAIGVYGYKDAKLPGKANLRNPADEKLFRDVTGSQVRDLFGVLRSRRD
jgi:hypothetical protein